MSIDLCKKKEKFTNENREARTSRSSCFTYNSSYFDFQIITYVWIIDIDCLERRVRETIPARRNFSFLSKYRRSETYEQPISSAIRSKRSFSSAISILLETVSFCERSQRRFHRSLLFLPTRLFRPEAPTRNPKHRRGISAALPEHTRRI